MSNQINYNKSNTHTTYVASETFCLGSKIEEIKEAIICEQNEKLTAKVYTEHDEKIVRKKINEMNKNLSSYKQIENVEFYAEEFPKTASNKIKRGEV